MENNTKVYSSKQEHSIADYLNWKVVSGSGARDFNPGDIRGNIFLGECKTHTKVADNIVFYTSVYEKILKEATSVFKIPAYFVDDGSQQIKNTFVVTTSGIGTINKFIIKDYDKIKFTKKRMTFSKQDIQVFMKENNDSFNHIIIPIHLGKNSLLLMSLNTFKELYGD